VAIAILALLWVRAPAAAEMSFDRIIAGDDAAELAQWGRRYEHGEGVPKDVDLAIQLYCKAARNGDAAAHYHLGWIYAIGRAGARDDDLAAAWFYKAAQRKDPHARRMLARLGYQGKPKREAACLLSDGSRADGPAGFVITRQHPARGPIATLVRELAPEYKLNPNLVLAVIEVESNFDPRALSPKNAQGLMQLIPATAERFGVADVWDPEQNVRGGMAYLRWLMAHFDGDVELVLAAYNAGEGAVLRHGGIPPYSETRDYVKRVIARLN
jgi:hypothetical protein